MKKGENKSRLSDFANEECYKNKIRELHREISLIKLLNNEERERNSVDIEIIQKELEFSKYNSNEMINYLNNVETSRNNLQIQLIRKEKELKLYQIKNKNSEIEVFENKKKIAEIINLIFEIGENKLMEKIEKIITNN